MEHNKQLDIFFMLIHTGELTFWILKYQLQNTFLLFFFLKHTMKGGKKQHVYAVI